MYRTHGASQGLKKIWCVRRKDVCNYFRAAAGVDARPSKVHVAVTSRACRRASLLSLQICVRFGACVRVGVGDIQFMQPCLTYFLSVQYRRCCRFLLCVVSLLNWRASRGNRTQLNRTCFHQHPLSRRHVGRHAGNRCCTYLV